MNDVNAVDCWQLRGATAVLGKLRALCSRPAADFRAAWSLDRDRARNSGGDGDPEEEAGPRRRFRDGPFVRVWRCDDD